MESDRDPCFTALLHRTAATTSGQLCRICVYTCMLQKTILVHVNCWHIVSHVNSNFHVMSLQYKSSDWRGENSLHATFTKTSPRILAEVAQWFAAVPFRHMCQSYQSVLGLVSCSFLLPLPCVTGQNYNIHDSNAHQSNVLLATYLWSLDTILIYFLIWKYGGENNMKEISTMPHCTDSDTQFLQIVYYQHSKYLSISSTNHVRSGQFSTAHSVWNSAEGGRTCRPLGPWTGRQQSWGSGHLGRPVQKSKMEAALTHLRQNKKDSPVSDYMAIKRRVD